MQNIYTKLRIKNVLEHKIKHVLKKNAEAWHIYRYKKKTCGSVTLGYNSTEIKLSK